MDVSTSPALHREGVPAAGGRQPEHVVVSNYGWYLFNRFPIACGNATPGASFPWRFFSNQVSSRLLHERMMSYAAARKANVNDLVFFCDEQVFFNVPGSQFPLPIPYVLCFREVQFSGVLTPSGEEVKQ